MCIAISAVQHAEMGREGPYQGRIRHQWLNVGLPAVPLLEQSWEADENRINISNISPCRKAGLSHTFSPCVGTASPSAKETSLSPFYCCVHIILGVCILAAKGIFGYCHWNPNSEHLPLWHSLFLFVWAFFYSVAQRWRRESEVSGLAAYAWSGAAVPITASFFSFPLHTHLPPLRSESPVQVHVRRSGPSHATITLLRPKELHSSSRFSSDTAGNKSSRKLSAPSLNPFTALLWSEPELRTQKCRFTHQRRELTACGNPWMSLNIEARDNLVASLHKDSFSWSGSS